MQIIDLLEGRIEALLDELEKSRHETKTILVQYQNKIVDLTAENTMLQEDLAQERKLKSEILGRIDGLLLRLKEHTQEEASTE
ncbi:MAG: hypothetical protein ACRCV3_01580 [Desulfovibrionaceae bacterium]